MLELQVFLATSVCGGRAPMCGEGGLRTWERNRGHHQNCCSARFRGFHQRRASVSVQHPPPRHMQASVGPARGRPARLIRPLSDESWAAFRRCSRPHHREAPHPKHAPRPRPTDTPQPRTEVRPISSRNSTDLATDCDRSRHGVRPISRRSTTDLSDGEFSRPSVLARAPTRPDSWRRPRPRR